MKSYETEHKNIIKFKIRDKKKITQGRNKSLQLPFLDPIYLLFLEVNPFYPILISQLFITVTKYLKNQLKGGKTYLDS
jgi:hypothetical protein